MSFLPLQGGCSAQQCWSNGLPTHKVCCIVSLIYAHRVCTEREGNAILGKLCWSVSFPGAWKGTSCSLRRTTLDPSCSPTCSCRFWGRRLLQGEVLQCSQTSRSSRVVTVSSMAHKTGAIFFDDLSFNSITYRPFKVFVVNAFHTF